MQHRLQRARLHGRYQTRRRKCIELDAMALDRFARSSFGETLDPQGRMCHDRCSRGHEPGAVDEQRHERHSNAVRMCDMTVEVATHHDDRKGQRGPRARSNNDGLHRRESGVGQRLHGVDRVGAWPAQGRSKLEFAVEDKREKSSSKHLDQRVRESERDHESEQQPCRRMRHEEADHEPDRQQIEHRREQNDAAVTFGDGALSSTDGLGCGEDHMTAIDDPDHPLETSAGSDLRRFRDQPWQRMSSQPASTYTPSPDGTQPDNVTAASVGRSPAKWSTTSV